jgi:hypothetical protein
MPEGQREIEEKVSTDRSGPKTTVFNPGPRDAEKWNVFEKRN